MLSSWNKICLPALLKLHIFIFIHVLNPHTLKMKFLFLFIQLCLRLDSTFLGWWLSVHVKSKLLIHHIFIIDFLRFFILQFLYYIIQWPLLNTIITNFLFFLFIFSLFIIFFLIIIHIFSTLFYISFLFNILNAELSIQIPAFIAMFAIF
jgi:hypothetical protein